MKEIRNIQNRIEVRAENEENKQSRHVSGYAIVFNSLSEDLGGFREIILPEAVEGMIEKSDVCCFLNHDPQRGILARSRQGQGSLSLSVDETGLKYSFDAPNTQLGDELLEGIRRNDINASSFAFTVDTEEWSENEDGSYLRTIKRFKQLFDVSPVFNPAYSASSVTCDTRGLDAFKLELEKRNQEEEEEPKKEDEEVKNQEENNCDPDKDNREESDTQEEGKETKSEDNTEEEEQKENQEEPKEEEKTDEGEAEKEENNKRYNVTMNKQFSLVNAINSVINNRQFDEATAEFINLGRRSADLAGVSAVGQIVLPLNGNIQEENRAANGIVAGTPTMGSEAVQTDVWNIAQALRDRSVLAQAGAQFLTLSNPIDVPVYSGSNVTWEGEVEPAKDGVGTFKSVKLTPKRLTAYVDISKLAIITFNDDIENLIRQDLINAINEKIQRTILGDGAGSPTEPKGIFNNVPATGTADFETFVNIEKDLEEANVYGDYKYIVSPSAKAALRTAKVDEGSGRFVMENNEINGIQTLSTNSVVSNGVALGVWSELLIGNFGSMDITVDNVSRAHLGQVRLVVNMYVDAAVRRPEAFALSVLN